MTIATTSSEKVKIHNAKLDWRKQMRAHYGETWTKKQRVMNIPKQSEITTHS